MCSQALMGSNEDMIVLRASTTFITLLGFFSIEAIIHGRSKAVSTNWNRKTFTKVRMFQIKRFETQMKAKYE